MTQEALKLALEALDGGHIDRAYGYIQEALAQPERDYERGFIDGMQKQMQSSVDKAVNAMSQRPWVGLTEDEMSMIGYAVNGDEFEAMRLAEAKLKEKNG